MTFHTTIMREIPVIVDYHYTKATRGARDTIGGVRGAGPPLEPDEPETVEIVSVKTADGSEYEITEEEEGRLAEEAFDDLRDRYAEAAERLVEHQIEDRKLFPPER
jgi:hypothetical protein